VPPFVTSMLEHGKRRATRSCCLATPATAPASNACAFAISPQRCPCPHQQCAQCLLCAGDDDVVQGDDSTSGAGGVGQAQRLTVAPQLNLRLAAAAAAAAGMTYHVGNSRGQGGGSYAHEENDKDGCQALHNTGHVLQLLDVCHPMHCHSRKACKIEQHPTSTACMPSSLVCDQLQLIGFRPPWCYKRNLQPSRRTCT
jgi:hypothetical protein